VVTLANYVGPAATSIRLTFPLANRPGGSKPSPESVQIPGRLGSSSSSVAGPIETQEHHAKLPIDTRNNALIDDRARGPCGS
jgi:hypothetical protein